MALRRLTPREDGLAARDRTTLYERVDLYGRQ